MICRELRVFVLFLKSKTCVCAILLRFSISGRSLTKRGSRIKSAPPLIPQWGAKEKDRKAIWNFCRRIPLLKSILAIFCSISNTQFKCHLPLIFPRLCSIGTVVFWIIKVCVAIFFLSLVHPQCEEGEKISSNRTGTRRP